ncbi:MAG TPA: TetR/AcrR family transcriptional regulator [Solirubrobacterales bacterium]
MAQSQRERLLLAMVEEVAAQGYATVSIANVAGRAKVSRQTFYEEFAGKEEALFEACDSLLDRLIARAAQAYSPGDPWPTKVRLALGVLLQELAADPKTARLITVELPAAGPTAHQRYRIGTARFMPCFRLGREFGGREEELPPDAELMAVGGAEAIIFDEVVAGRASGLPALLPDILFTLLVPYLGPERAVEQMRRAQIEA